MSRRTNRSIQGCVRVCVAVAQGRQRAVRREIAAALRGGVAVEDLREAILQTHLFAGFPRAINGLWELPRVRSPKSRVGRPGRLNSRAERGERLCRRIYGRDYEPMMRNMRRLSPDLAEWILEEGYGRVLSRVRFDARERELMIVPTLAAMGAWRQLPSHVNGALRVGAQAREIRGVMTACRGLLGETVIKRVLDQVK